MYIWIEETWIFALIRDRSGEKNINVQRKFGPHFYLCWIFIFLLDHNYLIKSSNGLTNKKFGQRKIQLQIPKDYLLPRFPLTH